MKILISIISLEEARLVLKGNPYILDIKNPEEGSLGAQFPWIIKDVVEETRKTEVLCSATLGDLPYKPGTASLATLGAIFCGVDYIKAGLYGISTYEEAYRMMVNIVRTVRLSDRKINIVASGYADYARFGGIHYMDLAKAAYTSGADGVMIDTAIKDGNNLFSALDYDQLKEFVDYGHEKGLFVALAGSIEKKHLEMIYKLNPDIVGIRGDVCDRGNRLNRINSSKVKDFINIANSLKHTYSII